MPIYLSPLHMDLDHKQITLQSCLNYFFIIFVLAPFILFESIKKKKTAAAKEVKSHSQEYMSPSRVLFTVEHQIMHRWYHRSWIV